MTARTVSPAGGMPGPAGLVTGTVLEYLLAADLPVTCWRAWTTQPCRLYGQLKSSADPASLIPDLAVYAGLLRAPAVLYGRPGVPGLAAVPGLGALLQVAGHFRGAEIEVSAHLTATALAALDSGRLATQLGTRGVCECGCRCGAEMFTLAADPPVELPVPVLCPECERWCA